MTPFNTNYAGIDVSVEGRGDWIVRGHTVAGGGTGAGLAGLAVKAMSLRRSAFANGRT